LLISKNILHLQQLTTLLNKHVIMKEKVEINTEQAILEAAEKEFLDKGYTLTKTTEIAKIAGVNHAMLHYYFRTKENLFDKVFQKKVALLANSFMPKIEEELPFVEKVEYIIKAHFDFLASNPKLPFFVLNEFLTNKERLDKFPIIAGPAIKNILEKLNAEMKVAIKNKEICAVDPVHLLLDIVSLNVFAFLAHPIIERVAGSFGKEYHSLLDEKRVENVEIILRRLRP
jgi:TetR/AcrR family transcriptional regulator